MASKHACKHPVTHFMKQPERQSTRKICNSMHVAQENASTERQPGVGRRLARRKTSFCGTPSRTSRKKIKTAKSLLGEPPQLGRQASRPVRDRNRTRQLGNPRALSNAHNKRNSDTDRPTDWRTAQMYTKTLPQKIHSVLKKTGGRTRTRQRCTQPTLQQYGANRYC